jgi:malate synthase
MSQTRRVQHGRLQVAAELDALIRERAAPGTGVDPAAFWAGFERILDDLVPNNRALLEKRDEIQAKIDAWHVARKGKALDSAEYKAFLTEIG